MSEALGGDRETKTKDGCQCQTVLDVIDVTDMADVFLILQRKTDYFAIYILDIFCH